MRHWTLALLLALPAPVVQAVQTVQLFDPPTHLRFSAQEVSEAAREHGVSRETPPAACDARCTRVQRIWQRLLPVALSQPRAQAAPPQLRVVESGSSAYARADGVVVFPLALAGSLALTDAEIAFVLAHEMVHVLLEHEREILTAADALLRPDVKRSAADIYGALAYDLGLSMKTGFLMQAAELEADAFGLQLAALAGYDPAQQVGALAKLLDLAGARRVLLPTHPNDAQRMQQLQVTLPAARTMFCRAAREARTPLPAACRVP